MPPKRKNTRAAQSWPKLNIPSSSSESSSDLTSSSSPDSTSSSDSDSDGSDSDIAIEKRKKKRPCLAGTKVGTDRPSLAVPHIMDLTEQFKSGAFSDCEVRCAGRVWKLHKVILCPQSKFFEAALTENFSEANNGVVTLEEQDPDFLNDVLQYLYSGNLVHVDGRLSNPKTSEGINVNAWLQWYEKYTAIYILADFLVLPHLLNKSLDRLREVNRNFRQILVHSNCPTIGEDFSERFGALVKLAYSLPLPELSTPRVAKKSNFATQSGSIRTIFVDFLLSTRLRSFERVLKDLMTTEPQLLVDLLLAKG